MAASHAFCSLLSGDHQLFACQGEEGSQSQPVSARLSPFTLQHVAVLIPPPVTHSPQCRCALQHQPKPAPRGLPSSTQIFPTVSAVWLPPCAPAHQLCSLEGLHGTWHTSLLPVSVCVSPRPTTSGQQRPVCCAHCFLPSCRKLCLTHSRYPATPVVQINAQPAAQPGSQAPQLYGSDA